MMFITAKFGAGDNERFEIKFDDESKNELLFCQSYTKTIIILERRA